VDFGPHTIHTFVSLSLVLAAAGVALVCDVLKGNNHRLRELAVELKIRNEEAERRANAIERKSSRMPEPVAARTAQIESGIASPRPGAVPERIQAPTAAHALAKVAAVSEQTERQHGRPVRLKREMSPAVAAVAQAAAAIVNNKEQQPGLAGNEREQDDTSAAAGSRPSGSAGVGAGMGTVGRKNWDTILKSTRSRQGSVIPFESIREAAVPAGFHDASMLQRAVESGRMVSGLILSIGSNALNASSASEVAAFLKSLAGPQDFVCQSGSDEYVLICHGEQGASAQQRLSAIAEKLWEFQLRSIGGLSVQFSWGSTEARGERIGEAVATAIEQMQETRQSRRVNVAKAV
jgi:hypothetical protein